MPGDIFDAESTVITDETSILNPRGSISGILNVLQRMLNEANLLKTLLRNQLMERQRVLKEKENKLEASSIEPNSNSPPAVDKGIVGIGGNDTAVQLYKVKQDLLDTSRALEIIDSDVPPFAEERSEDSGPLTA